MSAMPTNCTVLGRGLAIAGVILTLGVPIAGDQALGDVARREEERRKQTTAPGRVYTNDNLEAVEPTAGPTVAPAEAEASTGTSVAPAEKKTVAPGYVREEYLGAGVANIKSTTAPVEHRDEQYWRKLFADVRARAAKVNAALAAQEARLAKIQGDQTPTAIREREVLADQIARLQTSARGQADELTRWLTRASAAKVPEEWTR
jgi:hypothetical protein